MSGYCFECNLRWSTDDLDTHIYWYRAHTINIEALVGNEKSFMYYDAFKSNDVVKCVFEKGSLNFLQ